MIEKIGSVSINYEDYPGIDLYSDGEVEEKLLNIAKNHSESELREIPSKYREWSVLYHFSNIRENIIKWMPITKEDKVLEIGSGCGAITGALSEMAGSVTCVELSEKRSLINAYRHKNVNNVEIKLGNFKDVEKKLDDDYDYIMLIGVLEYAVGYMETENPYEDFLSIIRKHLSSKGKIVIAIENRLGLKYWAGCTEDHEGIFFEGIEGYPNTDRVRTFSKGELERIIKASGCGNTEFYYPYPDYKFPMQIFSDYYLPKKGMLNSNMNNFDRQRLYLFDESRAFDSIIEDGLFPIYSNSYLAIVEKGEE